MSLMSPEVNVFSRSITLKQFLSSLLDNNNFTKVKSNIINIKSENSLLNLRLQFNYFIQCTYTLTRMQLVEFFYRCIAILYKRNQTGIDIILPLFSSTENDDLAPVRFSYVLIQIKNHKEKSVDSNFPNSTASMLTPVYARLEYKKPYLPFLSLYMFLDASNPDFQIVHSGIELRGDEEKLTYENVGLSKKKRKGKNKDYGKSKDEYVESNENRICRMRYQTLLTIFDISDNIFRCINAKKSQLLVNLADV
ncbi:13277_t:CDS:1 [Funneliformis caledonium]|uniref:13277_t:CDS:1 n=1 Tax=Funneliformis caledonium TaxID=1117310 RepID=A0A9N8V721_9GLOM|nr:13277_t:CDS:1 [Funneliformis caledonium]